MGTKFRPFSSNRSAYNDGFYIGTSILGLTCDVVKTQKSCSVLSYELPMVSQSRHLAQLFTLCLVFSSLIKYFWLTSPQLEVIINTANGAKSQRKTNHHIITAE